MQKWNLSYGLICRIDMERKNIFSLASFVDARFRHRHLEKKEETIELLTTLQSNTGTRALLLQRAQRFSRITCKYWERSLWPITFKSQSRGEDKLGDYIISWGSSFGTRWWSFELMEKGRCAISNYSSNGKEVLVYLWNQCSLWENVQFIWSHSQWLL